MGTGSERVTASVGGESDRPPFFAGFDLPEAITLGLCVVAIWQGPLFGLIPAVVGVVAGAMERAIPYRRPARLHAAWRADVYHAVLTSAVAGGMTGAVFATAGAWLRVAVGPVTAHLRTQPEVLQIIEMVLLFDLSVYALHRAQHRFAFLWRFHSVHHSIEDLNWLASYRVHPVDKALNGLVSAGLLYVLGMDGWAAVLIGFGIVDAINTPWAHGNLRVSLGPLWWTIRNPEFHRWHHAVDPAARDRNFGQILVVWDVLFNTAYFPRDRQPGRLGLPVPAPASYIDQLMMPFGPPVGFAPRSRRGESQSTG